MPRRAARSIVFVAFLVVLAAATRTQPSHEGAPNARTHGQKLQLQTKRASPLDLEVAGNLAGLPRDARRYLRREDLLAFAPGSFTVKDDPNFGIPVQVRGVELRFLVRELSGAGDQTVLVAICKDWYRGYFPPAYLEAHQPVLALEINGQPPSGWPNRGGPSGPSMAPYLITHPGFTPSFKILAHEDEAQIPWGIVRVEFWDEKRTFEAIAPRRARAGDPAVQAGYRIAQQNCLRCHGPEGLGPLKGKLIWEGIGLFAAQAPKNFAAYVRNPQALNGDSKMPPNPGYDEATLEALISYFQIFSSPVKP